MINFRGLDNAVDSQYKPCSRHDSKFAITYLGIQTESVIKRYFHN